MIHLSSTLPSLVRRSLLFLAPLAMAAPLAAHLPFHLAIDAEGNVYFLDVFLNRIVKVTADGESSELTRLFDLCPEERVHALVMGPDEHLYLGAYLGESIWKVSTSGKKTRFYPFEGVEPLGHDVLNIAFDPAGVLHSIAWDYGVRAGEGRVYRVTRFSKPNEPPAERLVLREGQADFLDLHVGSFAVAENGTVYLSNGHRIWKASEEGDLALLAGAKEQGFEDGPGAEARFAHPYGMIVDDDGSLLVAELMGRVRRVTPAGDVTTLVGSAQRGYRDGKIADALFKHAFALGARPAGGLYVAEYETEREYRIRIVDEGRVTTLATIPTDGQFSR